jgi:hypothetical protein
MSLRPQTRQPSSARAAEEDPLKLLLPKVLKRVAQRHAILDANYTLMKHIANKARRTQLNYLASSFFYEPGCIILDETYMASLTDALTYLEGPLLSRAPVLAPHIQAWEAWNELLQAVWGFGTYSALQSLQVLKGRDPRTFWLVFWDLMRTRSSGLPHRAVEKEKEEMMLGRALDALSPRDLPFENEDERGVCEAAHRSLCTECT